MNQMTEARSARYRRGLYRAAQAGVERLEAGGSAFDAVTAATAAMEDSGIFNAGLGACLTAAGEIELDAAVMDGRDRGFGAVAGVRGVKNPIELARHVLLDTEHCILGGEGAAQFAAEMGLPFRTNYPSEARLADWRDKKRTLDSLVGLDSLSERVASLGGALGEDEDDPVGRGDTVGCIAMDREGNLAAAVSTGGIWMKQAGRIGDSPLPGAGIWSVNGEGAAVATGTGELILRVLLCREVVERMKADSAFPCREGIDLLGATFGEGSGGVIGIRPGGEPSFSFNTRGMGRALWRDGGEGIATAIWPDDPWAHSDVG
jgi:isoaspartyl peptidase/L-asparaginase-like protein (Ntn-hydrolase superfamily)